MFSRTKSFSQGRCCCIQIHRIRESLALKRLYVLHNVCNCVEAAEGRIGCQPHDHRGALLVQLCEMPHTALKSTSPKNEMQ